jgi:hypothetical protein
MGTPAWLPVQTIVEWEQISLATRFLPSFPI